MLNQMVNNAPQQLDQTFGALADPTRRAILGRLARGPATAGELATPHRMSAPAISRHLRVLEKAGLIARRREGRRQWCTLKTAPMTEASGWIEEQRAVWSALFDSLGQYLAEVQQQED